MDYSGKIITKNPVEPSQTSAPGVWTLDNATQAIRENNWPIAYVPNPISRSLRFNSADTTYLNRTPASAGNRKTWTIALWFKRTAFGSLTKMFSAGAPSGAFTFFETVTDNTFKFGYFNGTTTAWSIQTTQVFRDPSAWMHMVLAVDTTQATNTNRIKLYINGSQVTALTATYPSQNTDTDFNNTVAHQIGNGVYNSTEPFNGYMADFYLIDGQALDPTYFGMTDPRTGAWIPKKYSGTYGTNGFYLNFSDNSSTAALGTDYSGNSNTWTANNFSVTPGSGNDSLTDVPTPWIPYNTTGDVGGVVRGNYATLNPVASIGTYSNGNLDWVGQSSGDNTAASTIGVTSGKWYWEVQALSLSNLGTNGVIYDPSRADLTTTGGYNSPNGYAMDWSSSPPLLKYGGTSTSYGTTITSTSDVVMVALDLDNQKLYFGRNGTWFNSSNPATGTSPAVSSLPSSKTWFATVGDQWGSASSQWSTNFGQRPFAYTPPAGFKSLCTTNLPEPTVLDGGDYMNAVLYTGNGSTQAITGVGFQPDFIWYKSRSNAAWNHGLFDVLRGTSKQLFSNTTGAEGTYSGVTSFDADGFTVGSDNGGNESGGSMVAWNWKESATSGFDIVTYTGDGTSNRSINHNLGVAPYMIITKQRNGTNPWLVQFNASTNTDQYLYLNSTAGYATYAGYFLAATSTTYGWGTSDPGGNGNGLTYVSYLFAAVPGFSAFGSYTGNGSADGPFVYTGFRARYILIKRSDSIDDWFVYDTARSPYNAMTYVLSPNSAAADTSTTNPDDLSNGFKIRSSSGGTNASGGTYIYAAFAENPFKYSNAR